MSDKKKKPYKIVKSKQFRKQEKKLSIEEKKELDKALRQIQKNPMNTPNSMSLFGKPSVSELKQWMSGVKPSIIDLVFEYLNDKDCLNEQGAKLAREFFVKYIAKKVVVTKRSELSFVDDFKVQMRRRGFDIEILQNISPFILNQYYRKYRNSIEEIFVIKRN